MIFKCSLRLVYKLILIQQEMTSQQDKRLEFYSKDPKDIELMMGKKKPINPQQYITAQTSTMQNKQQTQQKHSGKFVNDVLLSNEVPKNLPKNKSIFKQQKRNNLKTKMCIHGMDCRHRFSCNYAHNEQELRKPFKNRKQVCKLYQEGKCNLGSACRDYHGNIDLKKKNYKYKTEICQAFLEGKCKLRDQICIKIHQRPEEIDEEPQEIEGIQEVEQEILQPEEPKEVEKEQKAGESHDKRAKNQIVEVQQKKIGAQQIVEDGLTFNFT